MSDRQKLLGYTNSKGWAYITLHIKKYFFLMKTFISPPPGLIDKIIITADFVGCILKYGVGINDYFQYNFYKRRAIDRSTFIVARNRKRLIKECNGSIMQADFDDKGRFNRLFGSYLSRDWIDMDECSLEDFQQFVQKHKQFIIKIKRGSGGNGISLNTVDENNLLNTYGRLRKDHVILEEILEQHPEMAKFNPKSVNTLRVITLVTSNGVRIMNAVFRCGNSDSCTDNFHHFGLAALIDVDTGIVITSAVDKLNNKYYIHPKTEHQIVGFRIPNWEKIIELAKEVAMVCPTIKYVGWDMAICTNGDVAVIEGNCAADPDILQMPDQIGKWPAYKEAIDLIN